jgi:hypothetical protein
MLGQRCATFQSARLDACSNESENQEGDWGTSIPTVCLSISVAQAEAISAKKTILHHEFNAATIKPINPMNPTLNKK